MPERGDGTGQSNGLSPEIKISNKLIFGRMVKVEGFLYRSTEAKLQRGGWNTTAKKVWRREALPKPEVCVIIAIVSLSDGKRGWDSDEGYYYVPDHRFKAIKVGRKTGGIRYVMPDDIDLSSILPFTGEETLET